MALLLLLNGKWMNRMDDSHGCIVPLTCPTLSHNKQIICVSSPAVYIGTGGLSYVVGDGELMILTIKKNTDLAKTQKCTSRNNAIIIIKWRWQHIVPWFFLAIHPYHPSLLVNIIDCIQSPHRDYICIYQPLRPCRMWHKVSFLIQCFPSPRGVV